VKNATSVALSYSLLRSKFDPKWPVGAIVLDQAHSPHHISAGHQLNRAGAFSGMFEIIQDAAVFSLPRL
jgi:hypothetical protein